MSALPPLVYEVTDADFERSVVEASHQRPVLVDFWADWCQPCKTLMPVLARVIEQLSGQVALAKVNTDEQQQLAMRMGIRSLPTVRLYVDGQAVGEFLGAQPEQAVRRFLAEHLAPPGDDALRAARAASEAGDSDAARRILADALAEHPGNKTLTIELAGISLADGNADEAVALLDGLSDEFQDDDDVRRLRGQAQFSRRAAEVTDIPALETRLVNPDSCDETSLHDGAALRVAQGRFEEALELLLRLLERNRAFGEDAARRDMLSVFAILGAESPLVREYRRRMASALF